ncbi:MAG: phosphatidylglycerophosphatase A [Alphaproteobacteria bacterium]|nr:MAG: phosphatidylglycerophosphatase A [Alphaproteobacteria bacterium]
MKFNYKVPGQLDTKEPYVWLASWFGCGFINPAPGTWGSLGALPFGIILYMVCGAYGLAVAAFIITLVGLWSADKFDKAMDGHDSKMIVIDEVAGQWIALIPAALNPILILFAFILFRFFDILKPWPISFIDKKVPGALGVMGDDILAGLFAAICVVGLSIVL